MLDPFEQQKIEYMADGDRLPLPDIYVTAHKYKDGWLMLADNPSPGYLGRFLRNVGELRQYLGGERSAGESI